MAIVDVKPVLHWGAYRIFPAGRLGPEVFTLTGKKTIHYEHWLALSRLGVEFRCTKCCSAKCQHITTWLAQQEKAAG